MSNKNKILYNNQHYIRPKNLNKKIFWFKFFYLLKLSFINLLLVYVLSFIVFFIIYNFDFFPHSGLIFENSGEFFFYDKNFIIFYLLFLVGFIVFLVVKFFDVKFINQKLLHVKNNNLFKKRLDILLFLIIVLIFLSFWNFSLFYAFLKETILIISMILLLCILNILFITKSKVYIKKPISNYLSIHNSFQKNNFFEIRKKLDSKGKKERLYLYIFLGGVYLGMFFLLFLIFFGGDIKHFGFYNVSKYKSLKLDNFVINNNLKLSHKHLGYESDEDIFKFLKENIDVTGLDIGNNNYEQLITGNLTKKLAFIDYGDFNKYDYSTYNNGKWKFDFGFAQRNYNKALNTTEKIIFKNLKYNDGEDFYSIADFTDGKKLFSFYHHILSNDIKEININFNTKLGESKLTSLALEFLKGKSFDANDVETEKEKIKKFVKNYLNYATNFYAFFEEGNFKKYIIVNINNFLNKENNYKNFDKKFSLVDSIKNPKVNFKFFDIDNLCNVYYHKFDCNILKQRFKDILNGNKKEVLLNNNYILSNYGKFYKAEEYKSPRNQAIILDIYFALKKREENLKPNLKYLELGNNYIEPFLVEKVISKFPSLDMISLSNLENKDDNFVIDLTSTDIKAFNIGNTNISFLIDNKNIEKKYIFMDEKIDNTCGVQGNYFVFPNIFKNKEIYLEGKGGTICSGGPRNNLEGYYGEFMFNYDFYQFYLANKNKKALIYEVFNFLKKLNLISKNKLTNEDIKKLKQLANKNEFKSKGEKYFANFIRNHNNIGAGDVFIDREFDSEKVLDYIYYIKAYVYYDIYSKEFKNAGFIYSPYGKMPFYKIYKRGNIIIFVRNNLGKTF